jgi:hypothetical protein
LEVDWEERTEALVRSGLMPLVDLEALVDPSECDTIELAADLMEQFGVRDLQMMTPWLRDTRRQVTKSLEHKRRGCRSPKEDRV